MNVLVAVDVGAFVGVCEGVLVGVTVGVTVGVGGIRLTEIVLLPETASSKRGAVCTMPLKSTRAVATSPLFTLILHSIDGKDMGVASEGDEKPDATVIGYARSGVPFAFGQ